MEKEKENLKQKIINLLKTAPFGLNVKNIAETLELSRTTVLKYLKILSDEHEVYDLEFGQYHIFMHKDLYEGRADVGNPLNSIIMSLYKSLIKNIPLYIDASKIKELGKSIAQDMHFTEMLNVKKSNNLMEMVEKKQIPQLDQIAPFLMNAIDSFCKVFDRYTWRKPIIMEDDGIIILQLTESELITTVPFHFHLISGFIEHAMNQGIQKMMQNIAMQAIVTTEIVESEKSVRFKFKLQFS